MARRPRTTRPSRNGSGRGSAARPASGRSSAGRSGGRASSSRSTSRRAGSSRGGSYRGGSSASSSTPMIVGGIALVAVIVLVIALLPKGGDDDANRHVQMPTMPPPKTTAKADQGPKRLPPPKLPSGLHDKARDIVEQAKPLAEQSDAAYKEALEAKEAGNVELYQEKLREAATLLGGINDLWNELIIEIDQNFTNNDWDAEQVANHYFAGESATIMKYLKLSQEINKQRAIR